MSKKRVEPVADVVKLLGRVVTQAQLTQFQINTINRRLDALEKTTPPLRQPQNARRKR